MSDNPLREEYYGYLVSLVKGSSKPYKKLLRYLFDKSFQYQLPMDGCREEDGVELRYIFGDLHQYDETVIMSYLDDRPCSIFELLIALASRMSVEYLTGSNDPNEVAPIFWEMISNLDLTAMKDGRFDFYVVEDVIDSFLFREYRYDGTGGIFPIKGIDRDMRNVDLWSQMCWYLTEKEDLYS